ncbi:hypothetical protein [Desulfovibrio inopinatus]|uniref:hypothetical protein n=1 Tax=Desulfovibrio inopinatus TaxID=102109 RepID=UPI000427AC88|nr:hypothetical protein [Desulfovibrio inopinatus]
MDNISLDMNPKTMSFFCRVLFDRLSGPTTLSTPFEMGVGILCLTFSIFVVK